VISRINVHKATGKRRSNLVMFVYIATSLHLVFISMSVFLEVNKCMYPNYFHIAARGSYRGNSENTVICIRYIQEINS
jgi:hypothetical protein